MTAFPTYLDRKRGVGGGASSLRIEPTMTILGHTLCKAVEWCRAGGQGQEMASTLQRAQNRAAKGSTFFRWRSTLPIYVYYLCTGWTYLSTSYCMRLCISLVRARLASSCCLLIPTSLLHWGTQGDQFLIKEEIKEQAGLYTDLPTYLHTIYDLLLVTHNVFTISL